MSALSLLADQSNKVVEGCLLSSPSSVLVSPWRPGLATRSSPSGAVSGAAAGALSVTHRGRAVGVGGGGEGGVLGEAWNVEKNYLKSGSIAC